MKNIKTFVISLSDFPIRTQHIVSECQKHNIDFEFFDAVNGYKLGVIPEEYNKLEFPSKNVKMSKGAMGCAMSHYILWNLIKYLPYEEFLILEDDCIFEDNFWDKFKERYEQLPPNWQMAFVGWIHYGKDIIFSRISDSLSVRIPSATHAYMIKKTAVQTLIESLHPIHSPVDLQLIDKAYPKLDYYVFEPSLVKQKSYLNFNDWNWLSSCYNWDLDLYSVKRKIINPFALMDGWYDLEQHRETSWVWSYPEFEFQSPAIGKIEIVISSIIQNKLRLFINEKEIDSVDIIPGNNTLIIDTGSSNEQLSICRIKGKLESTFIPNQVDSNSKDFRNLGICFHEIRVNPNDLVDFKVYMREIV